MLTHTVEITLDYQHTSARTHAHTYKTKYTELPVPWEVHWITSTVKLHWITSAVKSMLFYHHSGSWSDKVERQAPSLTTLKYIQQPLYENWLTSTVRNKVFHQWISKVDRVLYFFTTGSLSGKQLLCPPYTHQ